MPEKKEVRGREFYIRFKNALYTSELPSTFLAGPFHFMQVHKSFKKNRGLELVASRHDEPQVVLATYKVHVLGWYVHTEKHTFDAFTVEV